MLGRDRARPGVHDDQRSGFASAGSRPWSLAWLAAWVLDPTVSLILLAILRAEQVTARYRVRTGPWVRRAKWLTLAATYVMNIWASFAAGSPAAIVLHSVPPLVVFVAAEAITDVRDKLTEAVTVAYAEAGGRSLPDTARPSRRKLFADYLDEARSAWAPGVVISSGWVREVTGLLAWAGAAGGSGARGRGWWSAMSVHEPSMNDHESPERADSREVVPADPVLDGELVDEPRRYYSPRLGGSRPGGCGRRGCRRG